MVPAKLIGDVVDESLVPVVASQERVAVGGLDLEDPFANVQYGDIEGPAAQIVHGDQFICLLLQSVGQRGGCGLVDDAQHVKAGDLARVFGGLALRIVEVSRDCDHCLHYRFAQVGLGIPLELLQDHGRDLRWRVFLVPHGHPGIAILLLDDLVGQKLACFLNLWIAELAAHEALDGEDRVLRVGDGLALGDLPHHPFSRLRVHSHHGRA